jgi:hypothetical protein
MPLRGTTAWQHAKVMKKVINRDEGGWGTVTSSGTHYVICAFGTCDKDATEIFKIRVKTHNDGYEERWMNYVFCSEKCKQAWLDEYHKAMYH